jgi:hypothetical protein
MSHLPFKISPEEWDALHERCKCPRKYVGYPKVVRLLSSLKITGTTFAAPNGL